MDKKASAGSRIGIVLVISLAIGFVNGCSSESTISSDFNSSGGSSYEREYERAREEDRQRAYNKLRGHGLSADQAERSIGIMEEMAERDRQIRAGTYKKR